MAENRRSIDTKYWLDPDVEDFSKDATSLFMALLTFPENNMSGTYEISDKKIMGYIKFTKEELTMAINELESKGKILRHKSWISIKNHIKNQSLNGGMAVSAVKSLCESPNLVKLWLFFKENSQELEDWFNAFSFTVNKYYEEQRNKKAGMIVSSAKKKGELLNRQDILNTLPIMNFSNDQLVKIMTNNLPFKPKELSNYDSMITLTQQLDNSPLNLPKPTFDKGHIRVTQQLDNPSMNNEIEYEELNRNNEREELKGNDEYIPQHDTYIPPDRRTNPLSSKITEAIEHWNNKSNLPKCKYTIITLPKIGDIKSKFDVFRDGEIINAIDNLSKAYDSLEQTYRPKNFQNFIVNSLDNWFEEMTIEPIKRNYRTFQERSYFDNALKMPGNKNDPDYISFIANKKKECIDSLIAIGEEFIDYDNI